MPTEDDRYSQAVVDAVLDMTRKIEASTADMTSKVEAFTRHGDEARQQLQATVEGIVAALRTDVHRAIVGIQIDQVDHRKAHDIDRFERIRRQWSINLWMVVLTALLLVGIGANLALFAYIFVTRS